ncbi:MAG: T9SS type A sorting domain-containing protein [Bacteroidales bacterium]|jgi:hypothetical protein|nr:T9SS type A sorting domain-containing protein [Bacteroidales bacterium]
MTGEHTQETPKSTFLSARLRGFFCIVSLCICFSAQAQSEYLEFAPNARQPLMLKSATPQFMPTQLLSLPFFDDFAYPQPNPTPQLWVDNFAFVNTSFSKNPPTLGALTLDALNNNGKLYSNASSNAFTADYATSQPINLFDYRKMFASNALFWNNAGTFELFAPNTYFLYEQSLRTFVDVVKGVPYFAGDTLYTQSGTLFTPAQIAVYDEHKNLIPESLDNSRTWIPYRAEDNVALSFYYQAGGYGDKPEAQDSLVLECYVPYDRQGIFINEVTAAWLEIFNATDTVVSLAGYYVLPDTLEVVLAHNSLETMQLANISIAPYAHAIVNPADVAMERFVSSRYYLLAPDKEVIDSVWLEMNITAEVSYARLPDGNPQWSLSTVETPAQPNDSWHTEWNTSTDTGDYFALAYLPILPKYLQKGFRFRFKNYASLSNDASHARNEDFWNIDMVWIDANRTPDQKNIADVAFATPITPLYYRYTALPATHFSQLKEDDFRMTIESTFRNFDEVDRKIKFNFAVHNSHDNSHVSFPSFETDLPPFSTFSERDNLVDWNVDFFDFMKNGVAAADSVDFEFQYFFTDNNNPILSNYRWNDTSRVNLTFADYYAYDDGTPEAGYGLRNAPMGKVAFKFDILKPDTLRAVHMYFNPTLYNDTKLFNLCIWSVGANGLPDKLLYRRTSTRVRYAEGLYNFVSYPLEDEAIETGETGGIYMKNSFFVGWEQPYDVLLNIGMDLSNIMRNRLYFNATYQWEPSVIAGDGAGALLIRPQFGSKISTAISPVKYTDDVILYPTVVQSHALIQSNREFTRCEIIDLSGRTILHALVVNNSIDCSAVPNGLYIVKLYGSAGVVTKKCVIRK